MHPGKRISSQFVGDYLREMFSGNLTDWRWATVPNDSKNCKRLIDASRVNLAFRVALLSENMEKTPANERNLLKPKRRRLV